ncbi:hypothetical protein I3F58_24190 [Streptomyces sp. MUM 203J]|uniref:DUF6571 family protein n=1 Tax=Streptomyces sp. MUM 203J TaxID=2791990 RepID=UPI001F03B252|nr:DUF6571 family protein [Streptomyces sp. MUM 203J]MCH0542601.1 hypothetical protein [Streptomyces sp. MUM 203J]
MGLTYKKIMATDFGKLTAAAKAWDDMADEFKKAGSHHATTTRGLKGTLWNGVSHLQAQQHFEGTQFEYAAAEKQAKATADLIRDAHRQFTELKKRLESLVADATKNKMIVDADGNVRPNLSASERSAYLHDPDGVGQKHLAQYEKAAEGWAAQIKKYVQAISDADAGAKLALEGVVVDGKIGGNDQTFNGFNGDAQGDIEMYEQKDAQDIATRLNNGEKVTEAEVNRLARTLRDNNNEAFEHRTKWNQTFLSALGADGTLSLTNGLNDLAYFNDKKGKGSYLAVQEGLANSIATASHVPDFKRDGKVLTVGSRAYVEEFTKWRKTPQGEFYNYWLEDIRKTGAKEFDSLATKVYRASGTDQKALGYQSLITLMQHGEGYSSPFLLDLANGIRAVEDPTRGGDKNIWDLDHKFDSQKPEKGAGWFANDPLDGLLGIMSNNPDAATSYFDPQSYWYSEEDKNIHKAGSDNLEYLQTKRDWEIVNEHRTSHKDGASVYKGDTSDTDSHIGFGAALEAATTGNVPGTPAPEAFTEHTAAETRVMESVIRSYAEIAKIDQAAMPENIRVNMANSLAYYPSDVHQILANQINYAESDESTHPNGIDVSTEDMQHFIRAASEDGGAFRMIHDSQMGHIAEQIGSLDRQDLTQRPTGNSDRAMGVVVDAGTIMGTLDEVRADALTDERDRKTGENNWDKTYKYHTYGAPVTGIPVIGDSIQRMIDIATGRQAEELNNALADKTKEQLIEHYNKHGYPRLRDMINRQAETLLIPKDEMTPTGSRAGSLRTAASNSYTTGIELTQGAAGE